MRFLPIDDVSADSGESTSFPHLKELKNGDLAASAIKQVASGRFGVTPEYLVSAKQARTPRSIPIKRYDTLYDTCREGRGGRRKGPDFFFLALWRPSFQEGIQRECDV